MKPPGPREARPDDRLRAIRGSPRAASGVLPKSETRKIRDSSLSENGCPRNRVVPEEDSEVNPLGIKGLGELANVGTAAAISNAVYNATGKRVRRLPIRIDDMLI